MSKRKPSLSDCIEFRRKRSTVYRCIKDVECENWTFKKNSLILLNDSSTAVGEIYVVDFLSVCNKINNSICCMDYSVANDISSKVICRKVLISQSQYSEYFEEAEEINKKIKAINRYTDTVTCITCGAVIATLIRQ